jgi:hypothetical protein
VSGKANISGLWMGRYSYPFGGSVPFLASIADAEGALSGTIIEPNTMGPSGGSLEAILSGSRHGGAIDFTKAYDGASDAAHAVDYVGRLSGDGNSITGVWSLADADGAFEMHREASWEEAEELEAAVVPAS